MSLLLPNRNCLLCGNSSNAEKNKSRTAIISFKGVISNSFPQSMYLCKAGKSDKRISTHAPIKDASTAGIPNRNNTFLSTIRPVRINLKRLLAKCTTPVNATATSTGKNKANTGINTVPSPNPEKKVKIAVMKAAKLITISSIIPGILFVINTIAFEWFCKKSPMYEGSVHSYRNQPCHDRVN